LPPSEIALEAATEIIAESTGVAPILSPPADPTNREWSFFHCCDPY